MTPAESNPMKRTLQEFTNFGPAGALSLPRSLPLPLSPRLLPSLLLAALLAVLGAACTPKPTPYQPLGESGGFEETRLQENVYRVSFKANAYTAETDVLDYMYLRSAELTKEAGFSHFLIVQDYGKSQARPQPRVRMGVGLGFFSGGRGSFWGAGAHAPVGPSHYEGGIAYHLGVFVIRMLTAAEAKAEPEALEVEFLLKSVHQKLADRPAPKS